MKRTFATILVVALSLLSPLVSRADVRIVTVRAEGKCEISRFITKEQAEQKALQEAKNAALHKAGVDENVWSVFGMITESDGSHFHEAYSEMSVLAVGGLVHLIEEPKFTEQYSKSEKRTYVVCKIHAEVKKGETVDKSFQVNVKGIEPVYKDEELLDLEIHTSQDAYVRIFWFNKQEGAQILPNEIQKTHFVLKGEAFHFPDHDAYDLIVEKKDKKASTELVNVMVVATKKDYPFYESEVSFETLLNWIYDIPASDRCTFYDTFDIK